MHILCNSGPYTEGLITNKTGEGNSGQAKVVHIEKVVQLRRVVTLEVSLYIVEKVL